MKEVDCLVVGAGPAGLTAAIYLSRFRRSLVLADGGTPRAEWIPLTRNYPGFPDGISGSELLERLREQARHCSVEPVKAWVERIEPDDCGFRARVGDQDLCARTVLLATGIDEVMPASDNLREAVRSGALRLCPVCDAFEIRDRNVGVLFNPATGTDHVVFLRGYTGRLTALVCGDVRDLSVENRRRLGEAGISLVEDGVHDVTAVDGHARVHTASATHEFDSVYSMLGFRSRSSLAEALGAKTVDNADIVVDSHQRTSVPGLYAAGDVVDALNQLSVAIGHAAVAACAIHNDLRARPVKPRG
jgi:thioredoxin reductase (NADPH)